MPRQLIITFNLLGRQLTLRVLAAVLHFGFLAPIDLMTANFWELINWSGSADEGNKN
jgi:hypothetical protein